MRKVIRMVVATLALMLPAIVQAHVSILPRQSTLGATEKYVVRIPTAFLRWDRGDAFCYVARDGEIARVAVTTGAFGQDDVEIVDGLVAGDVVLDASTPRQFVLG